MATYNKTGTTGNDAWSFANVGGEPRTGNIYNLNGDIGTDSFRFDDGTSGKYIARYQSTNFTIGAAVGGVITVTGASTGGTRLTFNLTSVETLIFGDRTVTLTYITNTAPVFTSGTTGTVVENTVTSTPIYTATATDAEANPITFSLSGTDAALMTINSSTGAVTLLSPANYESKTSYSFTVTASDGTLSTSQGVVVSVTNLNDNAPVFTSGTTGTVVENAATSTVIYTATATDADNLGALSYSLSGTDASLLSINSSTGAVTLLSSANYETKTSYSFNVVASDGDPAHNQTKAVVVSVTNLNDNAPVFTSGTTGSVVENAATSTVIYTATATDADNLGALSYSLSGTDASLLSINSSTGAVTLLSSANYETKTSYSFSVNASDGTNVTSQTVVVSVTNVNEVPVFSSGSTGSVAENAPTSTVIYTAAATDPEGTAPVYALAAGGDASLLSINSSTGAVTLLNSANYEAKTSYSFTVTASDGTNTVTQPVVVSVTNLNDNAPVFTSGTTGTVTENAATSTVIYTATATDADNLGALSYSLSGTDASLLNINSSTGAVTLLSSANYETKTSYSFNVVASDGDPAHNQTNAVVVSVTNLNDNAPVFTSGSTGSVNENAATSTVIYTATATDADNLAALTYTLSGTDASLLNIDASTGAVTLKASADYETRTSYSFNVIASDGDPAHNQTQAVVVSVTNLNDNAPVFTSGSTGTVTENAATSTVIYTATATDADNLAALTYTLSGTDASLLNIDASTGAVTLKGSADYEARTSFSFNVVAHDGDPAHDQAKSVVVSVTNLNDNAPVFTSGSTGSVNENAATSTVIYTATATDVDNLAALTYTLSGTDASLLNIDATSGAVTLKASADYEAKSSYSFNVIASDGDPAHDQTKTVTVAVTNLNDNAPVMTSGSTGLVVHNDPAGTVAYVATATDADNLGALSYSLSGTDAPLLGINSSTGAVTLLSPANYGTKSSYSFTVSVSDGASSAEKLVIVVVQASNNYAPAFSSGTTGSVAENAPVSTVIYTASATDADGNPIAYSLSGTDALLLNINSGTGVVTLKSSADYEAKTNYSFTVTASDGVISHNVTQDVVVSVSNLNDNAPVFTSGTTGTVTENVATSTVIYTATATDADNLAALTWSLSGTDATLLNMNSTTGAVTLKASADYETRTSYSFNVVASDGTNTTSQAVVVSVTNLNDNAPVFTSGSTGTVAENAATSTVIYTATATDADNLAALMYTLTGTDASLLNIDATSGAVTLKASADYETKSSYSFNVVAHDGDPAHDQAKAVTVAVTNQNDNAPVFTSGSTGTVAENAATSTVIYTATATDADNLAALTYMLTGTDASLLNIDASTGAVTLKASADYETRTSYSFNVVASDGDPAHDQSKAVTVSVTNLNDNAPVFTSGSTGTVNENAATSTVIYTATATDADNLAALTWSLTGTDASLLNIDASTGAVTLKASADYETKSSYSFNVIAHDGDPAHDQAKAVTVSVTNLNDNAPVFTSGSTGSVNENAATSTVIYTATATDADNLAALTWSLIGTDASLLNIDASTGAVTLKASADYETKSSYSFNVIAHDGDPAHDQAKAVTVAVTNLNDNAPVFTSGSTGTVNENAATSTVIYTATATDADNLAALTWSLTGTEASLLNIDASTGAVTLKASADYETRTSYSFNVVASDGDPAHDQTKAVVVSVTNLNDNAPVFTSGSTGTVNENAATSTVIYTATATDADSLASLTWSLSGTDASLLNIDATSGAVTLKGSADYETKTSYSFNVVASDGDPAHNQTKAVTVAVTNLNDNAPVFTSGSTGSVNENAATSTVIYTATATDADNLAALTYTLSGTDASLLNIDATSGEVTLKASADYETRTSYSFNVTASDGDLLHNATQPVTVTVTNVNEAPSSGNDSMTTAGTVPLTLNDFGVFSDPDAGDSLGSVKITTLPTAGTLEYSSDGTNWNPVTLNQVISRAAIDAGHLRYTPLAGMTSATVGYQVGDSGNLYSASAYTLTVYEEQTQSLSAGLNTIGTTTVTVPASLTVENSVLGAGVATADQLYAFVDSISAVSAPLADIHTAIDSYVTLHPEVVQVQSLTLTGSPSEAVSISGTDTAQQVMVIDASALPPGTVLNLNNVEFAIIIGPGHYGGGSGSNVIVADGSNQQIVLGPDDDTIHAGAGNDTVGSTLGNDEIYGDAGNDVVFGGTGNDSLYGGTENDTLAGGSVTVNLDGSHTLTDDAGNDYIDGGTGDDTVEYYGNFSQYSVIYHTSNDTYSVVDTATGGSTDTVTGVEHFRFADHTFDTSSADVTAPAVSTFTPGSGSAGTALTDNVVVKFSENVLFGPGTIELHRGSATGALVESFSTDSIDTAHLKVSGDTLTINPTSDFDNSTDYYVTFSDGSIRDFAGNHYAGADSYHFSTVAAATSASGGSGDGAGVALAGTVGLGLMAWLLL